jgi:putative FmdB family regulatory protein
LTDLGVSRSRSANEERLENPARPGAKPVVKLAKVAGRSGRRGEIQNIDNRARRNHFKPEQMTYEYACTACGHAWEAEQSISAKPLTECPSCHEATAKRQVSGGAGFILKGGGWYADLYSSSGGKKADPSEKKADATDKASTTSDAKPKTESAPATTTSSDTSSTSTTPVKGSSSTGAASS